MKTDNNQPENPAFAAAADEVHGKAQNEAHDKANGSPAGADDDTAFCEECKKIAASSEAERSKAFEAASKRFHDEAVRLLEVLVSTSQSDLRKGLLAFNLVAIRAINRCNDGAARFAASTEGDEK